MTRTFIELPQFSSKWKGLGFTDDDLRRLQEELVINPKTGAVMRKTGGIRKMRFAFERRGKSGSVRVVYVDFEVFEIIYLLTAYAKNEKENLSDEECNELRGLIKKLEAQLYENARKGKKDEFV
ncbi:MAG: type II toxin-antitoxin system RelE/ParE family toxin [Clostridia bacterium]|nr:type II toxin-antitoxin system RelE/ParE family toxin [Clostridia bacterium]